MTTPPAHGPSYYVRTLGDTAVVTPLTDLDATLADHLRDDLMRAAADHPHVVVDLHAAKFIDSAALGLLVRARQEARQHGATFALVAPSPFVQTVLHTMRLDRAFHSYPDRDTALEQLGA
ncbi:STAS domain-containing protein [Actinoplanes sp. CA-131856]